MLTQKKSRDYDLQIPGIISFMFNSNQKKIIKHMPNKCWARICTGKALGTRWDIYTTLVHLHLKYWVKFWSLNLKKDKLESEKGK